MLRKTLLQWPQSRPYLVVVAISFALFWPTWGRLIREWLQFEQVLAHGLPTFLIFIGLLLIHPPKPVRQKQESIPWLGAIVLLVLMIFWGLVELVRIDTLSYLILPAGLLAICWTLLGIRAVVRFFPYVLLSGLSLPIWGDFVPLLVALATVVVGEAVSLMGVTALIEGANITLPYGRLVIADGCSGIRYFAISILVATITALLNDYRWKGWLLALAIGAGLALLVNWVRIAALVIIAYQTNMQSELVTDHELFGWVVYSSFLLPAMWLVPVQRRTQAVTANGPKPLAAGYALTAVAMLVGSISMGFAHYRSTEPSTLGVQLPGAVITDATALPLPIQLPTALEQRVWSIDGNTWVSVAQVTGSAAGTKLVPYLPKRIDTGQWFQINTTAQDGSSVSAYQSMIDQRRVVVAERFRVGSLISNSYTRAKLLQIPAKLTGNHQFALITIQSPCTTSDCDAARARTLAAMHLISLTSAH